MELIFKLERPCLPKILWILAALLPKRRQNVTSRGSTLRLIPSRAFNLLGFQGVGKFRAWGLGIYLISSLTPRLEAP